MWVYSKEGNLVNLDSYRTVEIQVRPIPREYIFQEPNEFYYQIWAIGNTRDEVVILWEGDSLTLDKTKIGSIGINVGAKWI